MKFNINDTVKVRLTDKGRDELLAQHEDLQLFVTSIRPYEAPKEDEQGYSTWKFWTLLQMFGDVMCGGDEYFEPEIILVDIPILEQQGRGDGEPVYQFIVNNPDHDGYVEWADCNHDFYSKEPSDRRRILYTAAPLAEERGEGEWIELGEGAIPVNPETVVEIKMRNGATDGPRKAGGFFWFNGNAVRDEMDCDIIAYRIIPEQPANQNGEQ